MVAVQTSNSEKEGKQTYAMQVLLEEVTMLRRRVKDLEDDGSAGTGSGPSVETTDNGTEAEVVTLRKELMKVENEKARMELDFMNQLSSFARENQDTVDDLRSKLFKTEEDLAALKARDPVVDADTEKIIENVKADFREEIHKLEDDLEAADKELAETRQDNDAMHQKIASLETQRNELLDEAADVRLEVTNGAKAISALQEEMAEMERHYKIRIEKLEGELSEKDIRIDRHGEEIGEMNDQVIKLEEKKGMLLDEITDLRMILDREEKAKNSFKKRLDELSDEKHANEKEGGVLAAGLEEKARLAEAKAADLEEQVKNQANELRGMTTSYKSDVARLEDTISMKDSMLEDVRKDYKDKDAAVKKVETELEQIRQDNRELKVKLDEASFKSAEYEREIASLATQRVAYEKRSSQCILEHLTEVDDMKAKNEDLRLEINALKTQLEDQKTQCASLKTEISNMKAVRRVVRSPPPIPLSPTNSRAGVASPGASPPGRTSVRALAACFEGKPPLTTPADLNCASPQYSRAVDPEEEVADLHRYLADELAKNEAMEKKLHEQSKTVGELRGEIASLTATRSAIQALSRKEYERQTQLDQDEILKLKEQLESTRTELEEEKTRVEGLKKEIMDRLSFEEGIMETYEQRNLSSRKDLNVEVNRLKVQLTEEQMKFSKAERDYEAQVKELQATIEELNEECDQELEQKQAEVDVLRQKVEDQKDEVQRLEAERQQLCVTMNSMSSTRRDELDELQAELVERAAECASLSRHVQSLEMQVENHREHTDELDRLRKKVRELELNSSPRGSNAHIQKMEYDNVKHENKRLKEQVRNVTLERRALQEKVNAMVVEKSGGRSVQVLRERNEKLRREVDRLNKKLEKLEGNVTRIAI